MRTGLIADETRRRCGGDACDLMNRPAASRRQNRPFLASETQQLTRQQKPIEIARNLFKTKNRCTRHSTMELGVACARFERKNESRALQNAANMWKLITPRIAPIVEPARTSLRKCIPRIMRDPAMRMATMSSKACNCG